MFLWARVFCYLMLAPCETCSSYSTPSLFLDSTICSSGFNSISTPCTIRSCIIWTVEIEAIDLVLSNLNHRDCRTFEKFENFFLWLSMFCFIRCLTTMWVTYQFVAIVHEVISKLKPVLLGIFGVWSFKQINFLKLETEKLKT